MKKTMYFIIFICGALLLIGLGMSAQAGINLDTVNKEMELSAGTYTIEDIWDGTTITDQYLVNYTDGTWLLNWSIVVETTAVLLINPDGITGCSWLKMNCTNASGKDDAHIDVQGNMFVNDTMITGWDYANDCNMTWDGEFRSYIYIVPTDVGDTPWASFLNSTIGYLGFNLDNKYGIVYEDGYIAGDDIDSNGWMHNCTVMENYIGINFQGCENMDVTDTWMNHTHEVGIVYTIGGVTANGAHGGYVGKHPTWTHRALYDGVAIDYCTGVSSAMGIRLCRSDNITLDNVTIKDAHTDGLWVEDCDNLTANTVISHANTLAADDANIYLNGATNSVFTGCLAHTPAGAAPGENWYLEGSGNNTFHNCMAYGATDHTDFYIDADSHYNNFSLCYVNESNVGFYILSSHNTFDTCTIEDENSDGIYLDDNAHRNGFTDCQSTGNNMGVKLSGDVQLNKFTDCSFSTNAWGLWCWPSEGNSLGNNNFTRCWFNSNTQAGIDIGRACMNYFYLCDIKSNTVNGVEVRQAGFANFSKCVSYQPSAAQYDWVLEDDAVAYIYGDYILGVNNTENNLRSSSPYITVHHASGDGAWTWDTYPLTAYVNSGHDAVFNLTDWTSTSYRKWYVTALSGTEVSARVGGLTAGTLYDLKVGTTLLGTYNPQTETILSTSTGVGWLNYTGGWSTKYFTMAPHSEAGNGNGGGGGSGGTSVTDDTTPTIPTTGETDLTFFVIIVIAMILVIIGMWCYYKK